MISNEEKQIIIENAKKFNLTSVILFGSSLDDESANDIDIGVKGLEPRLFFKFFASIYKALPKPVDVVDLSFNNKFTRLIEESGVKIYG